MSVSEDHVSLPEVHQSVQISDKASLWRRIITFGGPAFLVSVGYMDPGNWASDLQAGSQFGYSLIWVILLSNLMAILLQVLSARLGVVTGQDLAQACRTHYPRHLVIAQWIICEIAIAACDLAEVLGTAIALKLLFGLPILYGVIITAFDVIVFLALQSYGIRKLEALIILLVTTIGGCFAIEMFISKPPLQQVMVGFIPSALTHDSLYIAIAIIGATVMPHNLYLHSALVQSRKVERTSKGIRQAIKFNMLDSVVALNSAFLVNASILILAAAAFYTSGHHEVVSLEYAHSLLDRLLGSKVAPIAFAIALLAAGQSSTITGTMAGQIVMEGFVHIKIRPWLRRIFTRLLAVLPAVIVIVTMGESSVDSLLILSQVILSLQLSFAIVPLIHFTSDKRKMGEFANKHWAIILAWLAAGIIIILNLKLVLDTITDGLHAGNPWVKYALLPATILALPMLLWMLIEPIFSSWRVRHREMVATPVLNNLPESISAGYKRIAIAIEASNHDQTLLQSVLPLLRVSNAEVVLVHCVETAVASYLGDIADDAAARGARDYLDRVILELKKAGISATPFIGTGVPQKEIARLAEFCQADLIITGGHGHRLFGDIFHGSTVSALRHLTKIPVLSIRT